MSRKNKNRPAAAPIKAVVAPSVPAIKEPEPAPIVSPLALTQQDMDRIKTEEIFREEIKTTLKKQSETKWDSFKTFISSNFGLWVLSAILLTFVPYIYASFVASQTADSERKASVLRLKQEMKARLSNAIFNKLTPEDISFLELRRSIFKNEPKSTAFAPKMVPRFMEGLNELLYGKDGAEGVFDDFKDVSTRKLIMRLKLVLRKDDAALVEELNGKIESLKKIYEQLRSDKYDETKKVDFMLLALDVIRDLYKHIDKDSADDLYTLSR